jgi:hypothetical protein
MGDRRFEDLAGGPRVVGAVVSIAYPRYGAPVDSHQRTLDMIATCGQRQSAPVAPIRIPEVRPRVLRYVVLAIAALACSAWELWRP